MLLHSERYRKLARDNQLNLGRIEGRIAAHAAFYCGKIIGARGLFGDFGAFARRRPLDWLKGLLAHTRDVLPDTISKLSPPIRDIKQAIGTSMVVIIPTALMGAFKHYNADPKVSNVHWPTVLSLVPTAIIGGYLGAWLTGPIHADNLKRAFGAFIMVVGCRLLFFK